MSQIYLTKIERKTIFTKSLIFVLIMFIISDLTITGPFYFNFIPWLFLLGVLGSIKKIDNALMGIISTFTVFISSIITEQGFNTAVLVETICAIVFIAFGIITGKLIYEFILEHRLVKYIKPSVKTLYITLIIIMTVISFAIVVIKDGNIFTYLNSRANVEEYITNTYNIEGFKIKDATYNTRIPGKYAFKVRMKGHDIYFMPLTKTTFKDVYLEERLANENRLLQEKTNSKVQNIINTSYPELEDINITYLREYSKVGVNPDITAIYVDYARDNSLVDEQKDLYLEIYNLIKEITSEVQRVDKIIININGISLDLTNDEMNELTPENFKGGFEIEELDEKN